MGKGKAKGFRPPKDDKSMLFGNADHLTGNSIASPVQLRQEGVALPKNHLNFGDEWGKGSKGEGKGGATGANAVEVGPKAEAPPPAEPKPKPEKKKIVIEPTKPVSSAGGAGISEIERRKAALAEIEKRREKMLKREMASQQSDDTPGVQQEAVKEEQVVKAEEGEPEEGAEEEEEMEEEEEDEVSLAMARRRRLEEEEGIEPEEPEEPEEKKPRIAEGQQADPGTLKQGLQYWAERVNSIAVEGSSGELSQACRDFVRKRILRAHAEGNLHSVDWGAELVPSAEELLAAADG